MNLNFVQLFVIMSLKDRLEKGLLVEIEVYMLMG